MFRDISLKFTRIAACYGEKAINQGKLSDGLKGNVPAFVVHIMFVKKGLLGYVKYAMLKI